jgi:hypothetical protein
MLSSGDGLVLTTVQCVDPPPWMHSRLAEGEEGQIGMAALLGKGPGHVGSTADDLASGD